jgi:hypothetical protein
MKKVENKNAKRKMRKNCNAKGKEILQKENKNLEKTLKEFVLINKKSFTFLKSRGKT